MKIYEKSVPVKYIRFDNDAEVPFKDVISDITDMKNANFTQFNLRDKTDEAIFEIVKERCSNSISEICCFSDSSIRIMWKFNNSNSIDKLIDWLWSEAGAQ